MSESFADTSAGSSATIPQFPALHRLGLTATDLEALRRQGYLELRCRRGSQGYWRLRFRRSGEMKTVYVGSDSQRVGEVRDELTRLQSSRHRQRQLAQLVRDSKQKVREIKRRLTPALAEQGYHFHGVAIRKFRPAAQILNQSGE